MDEDELANADIYKAGGYYGVISIRDFNRD